MTVVLHWVPVVLVTLTFAAVLLAMWGEFRRPFDETDELCSRIDQDLEARGL